MTGQARISFFQDRRAPQRMQRIFRVVFAGGGTGGHLAPGIALADELQQQAPCVVTFFTTGKAVEQKMLKDVSADTVEIPCAPPGLGLKKAFRFVFNTVTGYAKALRELTRRKPHVVIALGGYGALPTAMAAKTLGIPLVVCEQNCVPGRATQFLSRWARVCLTQWPVPEYMLHKKCRQLVRGNPTRECVMNGNGQRALRKLKLDPRKRTLLLVGGSQGARALSNWAILNRDLLKGYSQWAQFVIVTGAHGYQTVAANFRFHDNVRVLEFAHGREMGDLLHAADLVVGRAGATTISECTSLGKPMVLVPYPHATDSHQLHNALYMARAGAALVYDETHLDAETWRVAIEGVLLNDWDRFAMADQSRHMGKPDAAAMMVRELLRIMGASMVQEERPRQWLASRRLASVHAVMPGPAAALEAHPWGHPGDYAADLDLPERARRAA
ncbi:MAG: glycosyltransferase [Planctomycetota bacterium]